MDQPVKVQMLENRDFVERIAAILMGTDCTRAWTEEFEDEKKISSLSGFVRQPGKIVLKDGLSGTYRSNVYKENNIVPRVMLIADFEGKVDFQVSNDGGRTWMNIRVGQTVHFSKKDRRLVVRAQAKGPAEIENIGLIW